jgi:hypothetical protein
MCRQNGDNTRSQLPEGPMSPLPEAHRLLGGQANATRPERPESRGIRAETAGGYLFLGQVPWFLVDDLVWSDSQGYKFL